MQKAPILFLLIYTFFSVPNLFAHQADSLFSISLKFEESFPDSSLYYAKLASQEADDSQLARLQADIFIHIGKILEKGGNFQQGTKYYLDGLAIYQRLGNLEEITNVNIWLARSYADALSYDLGQDHAITAIDLNSFNGDVLGLARGLHTLGYVYERRREPKTALEYYYKADSINQIIRNVELSKIITEGFGSIYEDIGMYDRAMSYYREFLANYEVDIYERIDGLNNIGDIYRKTDRPDSALHYYGQAYKLADSKNISRKIQQNIKDLALAYELLGDVDTALYLFKLHENLFLEFYEERSLANISLNDILYELDQKDKEIELQKARTENRTFQRNILIIGFSLIFGFAIFLWVNSRQKSRVNRLLEQQKKEILLQQENLSKVNEELNSLLNQLRYTQDQLVHSEKMATVGTLAAGIAHEINNPLNYIQGSIMGLRKTLRKMGEVSSEKKYLEEVDYHFQNSLTGVEKATKIVKSLMSFSRKSNNQPQEVGILDLIDNVIAMLKYDIPDDVKVVKDVDFDIEIECYPEKIHQVLLNVLTNSIHAITDYAGTEEKQIKISSIAKGEDLVIQVYNTGDPIPSKTLNKVFDPFFTTKEPGKGTGLGLSTSYNVIQEHGGEMLLKNVAGGVLCTVRLPRKLKNHNHKG